MAERSTQPTVAVFAPAPVLVCTFAGDAMTAALATGLSQQLPTDELLRRAVVAGAANAVHKGSGTPDAELVDRLARTVEIDEIGG